MENTYPNVSNACQNVSKRVLSPKNLPKMANMLKADCNQHYFGDFLGLVNEAKTQCQQNCITRNKNFYQHYFLIEAICLQSIEAKFTLQSVKKDFGNRQIILLLTRRHYNAIFSSCKLMIIRSILLLALSI